MADSQINDNPPLHGGKWCENCPNDTDCPCYYDYMYDSRDVREILWKMNEMKKKEKEVKAKIKFHMGDKEYVITKSTEIEKWKDDVDEEVIKRGKELGYDFEKTKAMTPSEIKRTYGVEVYEKVKEGLFKTEKRETIKTK